MPVRKPWLKGLAHLVLVLWGISILAFALVDLAPSDPAKVILEQAHESPSEAQIELLREQLGLNDSLAMRYFNWLKKAICLDLGTSWQTGEKVITKIKHRLPATIELALSTFFMVVVFSTISGVIGAWYQKRLPDRLTRAFAILSISIPNYWLGLLLIYFLAFKAGLFPVMGEGGLKHLILPVLTLGLALSASQGRVLRASILDVLGTDYIRFALAKGLKLRHVLIRHLLRNALPGILTMWGVTLGSLLGGAVIVESVFAWPGLGKLAIDAMLARDFPVVQAVVLIMALFYVLANRLVDFLQGLLDPRLAISQKDSQRPAA